MFTFLIALLILIGGYFVYSKVTERVFGVDDRKTPAIEAPDGVDKTPIRRGKAFLIELLNIAGTGPIFGAISGALFGPVVYIWIVFGCLLGGAVHDYFCGMISSRNDGKSVVFLAGKYIGKITKWIMVFFSLLLLILVTSVFVVSPSSLLTLLTDYKVDSVVFMLLILLYFLASTIFPIDKVIAKIYPWFGAVLLIMAIAVITGTFIHMDTNPMIEIIGHFKDFSEANGGLPYWPFMFTTVACGAVSGFHSTQAPVVSKCIRSEKDGRTVFYGAMVVEGIIALIWAAASIAFYKVDTPEGWALLSSYGGGNSSSVYEICYGLLGDFGAILAVFGVIICPITSGDTALRSCRLILGEIFGLDQSKIRNRLILTLPLFLIIGAISTWNFLDAKNFNLLWRWFAWSNQILAAIALTICTAYLLRESKNKFKSLITGIPMILMYSVVFTYILGEPNIALGKYFTFLEAALIGNGLTVILLCLYLYFLFRRRRQDVVDRTNKNLNVK